MSVTRRRLEERIFEIRHRLLVADCAEPGHPADLLEVEEELLDEVRELERELAAENGETDR